MPEDCQSVNESVRLKDKELLLKIHSVIQIKYHSLSIKGLEFNNTYHKDRSMFNRINKKLGQKKKDKYEGSKNCLQIFVSHWKVVNNILNVKKCCDLESSQPGANSSLETLKWFGKIICQIITKFFHHGERTIQLSSRVVILPFKIQ